MKHLLNILLLIILTFSISYSQNVSENFDFTGNLNYDSKLTQNEYDITTYKNYIKMPEENKKSPILGGLMSLVLPGSGEFYAGSYWKAAVFVALEATAITFAITYDSKGDEQTDKFQNYADEHWSVYRYAKWLIENKDADPAIIISDDQSLPPWKRVDWNLLNQNETGSHNLPMHGEQQYYELIGKYHQYTAGWDDYNGGDIVDITPRFRFYADMRGKANDYYSVAKTAVIGIYINHFLSAVDAVWSVSEYNNDIAMKIRVQPVQLADRVEYVPTLNLSFSF